MQGRPRKPTAIRRIEGNPGKRPLNEDEPEPLVRDTRPPAHLDRQAKQVWRVVAPELDRLGLLTTVDEEVLAGYCIAASQVRKAMKLLSKEGFTIQTKTGYLQQRPEVAILQKSLQLLRAFAAEFGFTPSSRTRLSVPKNGEDLDDLLR